MTGIPIGANTFSYIYTHPMIESLRALNALGFFEFEILAAQPHFWAADLNTTERRDTPRMLADEGLHINSVNIPGIDNNIVSSTREMRAFTVEVISGLVDLCGAWDIDYCILVPGRTMGLWPVAKDQLTEWFVEGMTKLSDRARDQGVTMLVENVPNIWIPRADDVMTALDALGRSDVGVIYYCANAPFAGEDPLEGVRIVRDRLRLVHLSDTHKSTWMHDPVGMGDVDFAGFRRVLGEIGYDGMAMLELVTRDPDRQFTESRRKLAEMGWD